jgi:hypothetical protein
MSLTDLASVGSFVSRATRVTRIVDIMMDLSEPSLADAVTKASEYAKDVTDREIHQFMFYCGARFAEDSFNQFREGLLNQVTFDSLAAGLKHSLAQPCMRAFYKRQRAMLGRDFSAFVDKLLVETALGPPVDSVAQWRADVAAELAGR